ncbi:MAG TPA: hypothetical protein VJ032_01340 [Thermoanaerobaculia bacterium]|nr:hypothetical protein [Thermoanaerobaculia bacterium]
MTDDRVKELLRSAVHPTENVELKRDLWPEMRRRIDQKTVRVSLFDWALIAAVLAFVVLFPQGAIALLYHL